MGCGSSSLPMSVSSVSLSCPCMISTSGPWVVVASALPSWRRQTWLRRTGWCSPTDQMLWRRTWLSFWTGSSRLISEDAKFSIWTFFKAYPTGGISQLLFKDFFPATETGERMADVVFRMLDEDNGGTIGFPEIQKVSLKEVILKSSSYSFLDHRSM